jgi:FtsP/CotA-like multicopper oxidase with cupredoxin domain
MFKDNGIRILATLLAFMVLGAMAGCSSSSNGSGSSQFPQPEERTSSNGVLESTLEVSLSKNVIRDVNSGEDFEVETATYEGSLIGPTLRIKPGDTIFLDLINNLPQNPEQQRMGAFPHDPFTTNFHTHGLTVDPGGISDNVFRKMEPQTSNPVEVRIPADHECGTFWYHPHKHGSVSFQFFGGMSGFLIIEGCEGKLDEVPEVLAAEEILMAFQVIRTDEDGKTPFVNQEALQLSSEDDSDNGLWSEFKNSRLFVTTNGLTNPTLRMRPGEVQRWRLLNAGSGLSLIVALEDHSFNIIANDGITVENMQTLEPGEPYVMGAGNRVDVLVKAGEPGIYLLQDLDPSTPRSVTSSGVDPAPRNARIGGDFPDLTYPVTLATIVVEGPPIDMDLPQGPLPLPERLPGVEEMLETPPEVVRNVVFETCGQRARQANPENRLPSCGWYFSLYDADYWGGTPFTSLLMMRDADDDGVPNDPPDPEMPRVDYQKEGLFDAAEPLFDDMLAGNFEEWTVYNRSSSDHTFHIHVNSFLITHINDQPVPVTEWRDTILIPAATGANGNINNADFGSITFRTWFDPRFTGSTVMHCHILTHEDVGMMQRLDIIR